MTLEENLMKYRSFLRLSIALIVLIGLMFGTTAQPAKASATSCGVTSLGGGMNWSGYMPQSTVHDFGTMHFNTGDEIVVSVTVASRATYPNTDILMSDWDHQLYVGGNAPAYFKFLVPASGNYHFILWNGLFHSDGPVYAVVKCYG